MKKTLQEERQRMVNIMSQIDKTFVLKEGRYSGYERLDPPDDYWGDDEGQGEPETPSVNTEDFKLHGGIENPGNYLYTVYETEPNSEFGNVLMQAAKYADDNSSWSIEFMKTHPDARETEYKRNNKGIYGHDFSDEDIPRIKEVLNKHINVKGVPEFMKAMDEVSGGMKEYEENRDRYESRGSYDNFNEPENDRDYDSSDPKNEWMDYINEDKKMSELLNESTDSPEESNGATRDFGRKVSKLVSDNIDAVGVENVIYVLDEVLKSIKLLHDQDSNTPTNKPTEGPSKNLADLGINGLNFELNKAIDNENWQLAQQIQKMIERKQGNQRSGDLHEGNPFAAAVNKAREEGKDTFEVGGKTYNVKK